MRVCGNCLKYIERGGTEMRGGETKIFKKGGQAGSKGGCLKRGGWNLLTNYVNYLSQRKMSQAAKS